MDRKKDNDNFARYGKAGKGMTFSDEPPIKPVFTPSLNIFPDKVGNVFFWGQTGAGKTLHLFTARADVTQLKSLIYEGSETAIAKAILDNTSTRIKLKLSGN